MAFLLWKDQYSVKIPSLDDQHKKLIDVINDLVTAIKTDHTHLEIAKTVDELIDYTEAHFKMEEELMMKYGYPGFNEHKMEHAKLTEQVFQLKEEILERSINADELLHFLMDWLVRHIMKRDKNYSDFFITKGVS